MLYGWPVALAEMSIKFIARLESVSRRLRLEQKPLGDASSLYPADELALVVSTKFGCSVPDLSLIHI